MITNKLENYLGKAAADFTKSDLIRFITENNIQMLNFRYVGGDGKLKTLQLVVNSLKQMDVLLSGGERVDGSSLFTYVEANSSDLYVVPRYKTAYLNPFAEVPTLDILCNYFTNDGNPLVSAPYNIMKKAHDALKSKTGFDLYTMGELEYYVVAPRSADYPAVDQRGYHESAPFAKYGFIVSEAMQILASMGATIKYGHSEVGNFKQGEYEMEQYEIEMNPTVMEEAADQVILTKWVLRNLGLKYGVNITFAPKITVGKAGSGMHVHCKLMKNGKNMMVEKDGLSEVARKFIAGMLDLAPSLTAFGNTVPTSYLRLVPHQEAPTNICWGDRNRSVLVRVPLGWLGNSSEMVLKANPAEPPSKADLSDKQTVEFRCPDGSANTYLLMAGLAVAARHGLEMKNALDVAARLYVDVNIFKEEHKKLCKKLEQLPASCSESADRLLAQSAIYCENDVFTPGIIEALAKNLKAYDDKGLSEKLFGRHEEIKVLVDKYLHQG